MVLTQFELKSWSNNNDDTTSMMDTNFLYNSTTECLEQQPDTNPHLFSISSSNGYYGYQPVTTSMKQENLIINDCDMSSMHCDNIVQENNMIGGDSDMRSKCDGKFNNQQILTYLGHETKPELQQRCAVLNSSQRKRRYDTNYELKQCSKKLRQEESMRGSQYSYGSTQIHCPIVIPDQRDGSRCLMGHYI
ncbi:uncharacterized protein LOC123298143 isoform X2 [Chrysoperla carnea]|uniref:uncharacterized protein LOC123298143 isoform X2 n=1 Tax=Chrysoperla carnea TaxID=189513 RepID=UPI001D06ECC4|nr:uncharacterized protein LOC123298143 isoform X2 [Chrysoperla carnea]